jgi:hypothetical protein
MVSKGIWEKTSLMMKWQAFYFHSNCREFNLTRAKFFLMDSKKAVPIKLYRVIKKRAILGNFFRIFLGWP